MVYEAEPPPRFASFTADARRGVSRDHFERVFSNAVAQANALTERDRLSIELVNASFFQRSADSRFLVLIMAIEALIDQLPRSTEAIAHVDSIITSTQEAESLSTDEKRSLLENLKRLKFESINQAGRRLAEARLGERSYMNKKAPSFFSHCYSIRSRLVHGEHPLPTQEQIGSVVAQLEVFVSDLVSGALRDVQLS
jgi:hypothetical protein